jgi:curli biogenesis system outer membrane secretion channel CsgG
MKTVRTLVVVVLALALAGALVACKKKEAPPTAVTAKTAATATAAVTCPKPGEDLICQDCKTLFMTPEEYRDHMSKQHPDKWAMMQGDFEKNFPSGGGTAAKK